MQAGSAVYKDMLSLRIARIYAVRLFIKEEYQGRKLYSQVKPAKPCIITIVEREALKCEFFIAGMLLIHSPRYDVCLVKRRNLVDIAAGDSGRGICVLLNGYSFEKQP